MSTLKRSQVMRVAGQHCNTAVRLLSGIKASGTALAIVWGATRFQCSGCAQVPPGVLTLSLYSRAGADGEVGPTCQWPGAGFVAKRM